MTMHRPEQLFIRRDGVVLGPFPPEQLKTLRAAGKLPEGTEFSPDKREWRRSETPAAPREPSSSGDAPQTVWPTPPPAPVRKAGPAIPVTIVPPGPALKTAESRRNSLQLLGDTIALLWDGDGFLRDARCRGRGAALLCVFFAMLLAFVLCGTALGLFAARYSCSPSRLAAVVLGALPGSLIFFYLGLSAFRLFRPEQQDAMPELDLVAAAFGTLHLALLLTLVLALAFLENPALYHLPRWGGSVLAASAAAAAVFCIGQTTNGFRSHLRNSLAIAPGRATGIGIGLLWCCLTAIGYFLIPCIVF